MIFLFGKEDIMEKYKVPVLETERLILRAVAYADAKDMFEYASNESVSRYTLFGAHASLAETKSVIREVFLSKPENGIPESFAIVDKETNKMIGTCDFWPLKEEGVFEMGYALHQDYWGKGIMTEAGKKVLDYAFCNFPISVMSLKHHVDNPASGKVALHLGFTALEVVENGTFTILGEADAMTYELKKENFKNENTR